VNFERVRRKRNPPQTQVPSYLSLCLAIPSSGWVRPYKVLQSTNFQKVAFKGILLTSQSRTTVEGEGGKKDEEGKEGEGDKEGDAPSLALPVIGPISSPIGPNRCLRSPVRMPSRDCEPRPLPSSPKGGVSLVSTHLDI
jgi:hypothetical protein